jgi:hypothetical protein
VLAAWDRNAQPAFRRQPGPSWLAGRSTTNRIFLLPVGRPVLPPAVGNTHLPPIPWGIEPAWVCEITSLVINAVSNALRQLSAYSYESVPRAPTSSVGRVLDEPRAKAQMPHRIG